MVYLLGLWTVERETHVEGISSKYGQFAILNKLLDDKITPFT